MNVDREHWDQVRREVADPETFHVGSQIRHGKDPDTNETVIMLGEITGARFVSVLSELGVVAESGSLLARAIAAAEADPHNLIANSLPDAQIASSDLPNLAPRGFRFEIGSAEFRR